MKKRRNEKIIVLVAVLILVTVFVAISIKNNLNLSPMPDTCPEIAITQAPSSCVDSDGNNIFNKGYIELKFGLQEAPTVTAAAIRTASSSKYWDECSSKVRVCELGCNGKMPKTQVVSCPNGYYCNDGKCIAKICGNNITEDGEECDGNNLNGMTCEDFGYLGGNLSCNSDCTLNTNSCYSSLGSCTSDADCTKCYQCNLGNGQCEPKSETCADFTAYELTSVDPDGTEHWRKIDLATENIEKGLKIKLDASASSSNAAHFEWDFGDYSYGSNEVEIHQITKNLAVTLTVYNEDWSQWSTTSKTIYVAAGMQFLSRMPPAPDRWFTPSSHAFRGENELWVVGRSTPISGPVSYVLGFADISNPNQLPAIQTILNDSYISTCSNYITIGTNFLALNCGGAEGIRLFHTTSSDPMGTFLVAAHLTSAQMGVDWVYGLSAYGNYLYARTPNGILVINATNPDNPLPLGIISSSDSKISELLATPEGVLVALRSSPTPSVQKVYAYDIRTNGFPQGNPMIIDVGSTVPIMRLQYNDRAISFVGEGGTNLFDIVVPSNPVEPVALENHRASQYGHVTYDASRNRLYLLTNTQIFKYDISDASNSYLMESPYRTVNGFSDHFLWDPDGSSGPEKPVLYFGIGNVGYENYR